MTALDPSRWRILSPLLDEALELSTDARAAWLARLGAEQPDLAAEVKALLDDHTASAAARFLTGSAASSLGDAGLADASLAGQTLGAYTLDAPIGQGGMGSVWLAQRSDGRFTGKVAVKLLNASLIGRAGGERFKREGKILAHLAHPNIARLIDAGVTGAGQPYLVLEYVEGESIDRYCDGERLDVAARVHLFLDVLAAVAHSHANLIVHRDIKPLNVLIAKDGKAKLLDFGIAKLLEDGALSGDATELTREGGRALTPEYAAPEQMLGEPITTATDVYALGVLLYVLLGGQHPAGQSVRSTAELIKTIVDVDPPRLSDAVSSTRMLSPQTLAELAAKRATTPEKLRRLLRGDLDNIVAKALKKNPAERYATVDAFGDDLRRHLVHQPVSARPDTWAYRVGKFARRHRGAVAAGVLTGAAIVAGVAGTITQARRAAEQAERAEQQAQQAQRERDRTLKELTYAEASDEFLSFLLQEGSDKPFTTAQLLARGEELVDRQFADDPELRARLLLTLANLYGEAMEQDKAQALLLRAQVSASGVADASLQASVDCSLAERYGDGSAFDRAQPLFDAAIARLRGEPDGNLSVLAACLTSRSMVDDLRGDAKAALADAQAALASLGSPRPGQRSLAVSARTALADAHGMLGQEALAVAEYRRAVDEVTGMGRGRTLFAVTLLNDLGVPLSRAGQWLRAAEVYERGLAVARQVERANALRPSLETNYAKLLVEFGRTGEAKPLFERALASAMERGHVSSIGYVSLLSAPAWCAAGDFDRCESLLARARQQLQATLPAGHATLGTLETEEAQLALGRRQPAIARDHLRRALSIFDAATEKNPNRLRALALLPLADLQLGDGPAASEHATQAVAQARAALAGFASSAWLGNALLAQGTVQKTQGEQAAAAATLREALAQLQGSLGDAAPATQEARTLLTGL